MNVLRLPFLFSLRRFPPLGVWCLVQQAQWNKFPSSARGRRRLNWRKFSGSSPKNIGGECAGLPIYLLMFMERAPSKIDELVSSEEYLLSPLQNHRGRVTRIEALPCTSPLQGRTIFFMIAETRTIESPWKQASCCAQEGEVPMYNTPA